jgi:hypothetical protein
MATVPIETMGAGSVSTVIYIDIHFLKYSRKMNPNQCLVLFDQ